MILRETAFGPINDEDYTIGGEPVNNVMVNYLTDILKAIRAEGEVVQAIVDAAIGHMEAETTDPPNRRRRPMTAKKKPAKKPTMAQLQKQLEDARELLFEFVTAVEYEDIGGVHVDSAKNHFVRIGQAEWYDAGGIYMEVCKFFGRKPLRHEYQREFTFDIKMFAEISVRAADKESAAQIIKDSIDGASSNLGMWPNGEPILTDVSIDGEPDLVEEEETDDE